MRAGLVKAPVLMLLASPVTTTRGAALEYTLSLLVVCVFVGRCTMCHDVHVCVTIVIVLFLSFFPSFFLETVKPFVDRANKRFCIHTTTAVTMISFPVSPLSRRRANKQPSGDTMFLLPRAVLAAPPLSRCLFVCAKAHKHLMYERNS